MLEWRGRVKPKEVETLGVVLVEPVISLQGGRQDLATISEVSKGVFPSAGTHLPLSRQNGRHKLVCVLGG